MKVYYILLDAAYDCDCTDSPRVFLYPTKEAGLKAFEEYKLANQQDFETWGIPDEETVEENIVDEDGYGLYSLSYDGRWCEYHTEVQFGYQEI